MVVSGEWNQGFDCLRINKEDEIVQDAQFVFCAGFAVWVRFCRAGVVRGGCDRGLGLGRVVG